MLYSQCYAILHEIIDSKIDRCISTGGIVDRLWAAIARIVDFFAPAECPNYRAIAGYGAL